MMSFTYSIPAGRLEIPNIPNIGDSLFYTDQVLALGGGHGLPLVADYRRSEVPYANQNAFAKPQSFFEERCLDWRRNHWIPSDCQLAISGFQAQHRHHWSRRTGPGEHERRVQ
jgi:hypothetical protein